jgi:hypothetical protein
VRTLFYIRSEKSLTMRAKELGLTPESVCGMQIIVQTHRQRGRRSEKLGATSVELREGMR